MPRLFVRVVKNSYRRQLQSDLMPSTTLPIQQLAMGGSVPNQQYPNQQLPNQQYAGAMPNQQYPNQQVPNQQYPGAMPNQQMPNQQFPNQQMPNQQYPGAMSNQQMPNQQIPNQQMPNQQFPNQQMPNQQYPGAMPNQQMPNQQYQMNSGQVSYLNNSNIYTQYGYLYQGQSGQNTYSGPQISVEFPQDELFLINDAILLQKYECMNGIIYLMSTNPQYYTQTVWQLISNTQPVLGLSSNFK
jgi:hypothetical protein